MRILEIDRDGDELVQGFVRAEWPQRASIAGGAASAWIKMFLRSASLWSQAKPLSAAVRIAIEPGRPVTTVHSFVVAKPNEPRLRLVLAAFMRTDQMGAGHTEGPQEGEDLGGALSAPGRAAVRHGARIAADGERPRDPSQLAPGRPAAAPAADFRRSRGPVRLRAPGDALEPAARAAAGISPQHGPVERHAGNSAALGAGPGGAGRAGQERRLQHRGVPEYANGGIRRRGRGDAGRFDRRDVLCRNSMRLPGSRRSRKIGRRRSRITFIPGSCWRALRRRWRS